MKVVGRQHVGHCAVDGQDPAREIPRVPRKKPQRVRQRGVEVSGTIADDKGVAFQDADCLAAHAATGTRRRRSSAKARSPEHLTRPCMKAVTWFCLPTAILMKSSSFHFMCLS